jgi:hypothetical protein
MGTGTPVSASHAQPREGRLVRDAVFFITLNDNAPAIALADIRPPGWVITPMFCGLNAGCRTSFCSCRSSATCWPVFSRSSDRTSFCPSGNDGRRGRWAADGFATFFEHRIRTTQEYREKAHYIRQNPVRKGLVTKAEEWAFVWEMHA